MGLLRFGEICGFPSWVVTDSSGMCAEGRRLDGKPYPATKQLNRRKAHTIKHSAKNWPVGVLPAKPYRKSFDRIALVEGGPDLLAVVHFALRQRRLGVLPVAILGRGVCRRGLHPESLEHFRGMRIRIYPHDDVDIISYENVAVLKSQLEGLGCEVYCFTFRGLKKRNGERIKDLNECVDIAPDHAQKLEELFL
jgi:hypothetical protein